MQTTNAYFVLGTQSDPMILFYHEVVSPRSTARVGEHFGKMHTQEYYEFSFFISGKRSIKVGECVHSFKGGEIFLAMPGEEHGGSLTHGTLDRYRLHIFPRALERLPVSLARSVIFRRAPYSLNRITLDECRQEAVYTYLSDIDRSIKLGHPETRNVYAYADILKLLSFLCDRIEGREASEVPASKLLLDVLSFIESSYDTVTVSAIEQHFCLSHATLWRMFTRELGSCPSAYIMDMRLKKARAMLSQGFDVQTVSDQCGFCDCSYFIKKFKKKYGETPYRHQAEKEL